MSDQPTLGIILQTEQPRDAIHIAIVSVVADERIVPGSHVGFTRKDNTEYVGVRTQKTIGVADPFLRSLVNIGERFYLFLYPQTITSLRHNWTHPDFAATPVKGPSPALDSEAWLRKFCETNDCPSYDTVMEVLNTGKTSDVDDVYGGWGYIDSENFFFNGRDAHADIPAEFWVHAENVLGRKITMKPASFSCSC